MPLSFESILDRTTALGPVESRPSTGGDRDRPDQKRPSTDAESPQADAIIGLNDNTRRLRQAMRDTNAGITLLQIADGSLNEIRTIFNEMRALVEQATTPIREAERYFFQAKLDRLTDTVNDIASNTCFEEIELLNGTTEQLIIQIDHGTCKERIELNLPDMRTTSLGIDLANIDVGSNPSAQHALPVIDKALEPIRDHQKHLNGILSQLEGILHQLESQFDDARGQNPRISGADLAIRTATIMREYISNEKNSAIAAQIESLHQDAKHLVS